MNALCNARRRTAGVLCGLLLALPFAAAASATAGFFVTVKMGPASQGVCASEPLGDPADFQVSCTSGQFVSMWPQALRSLAGTPGVIFRYQMMSRTADPSNPTDSSDTKDAPAIVTAMRGSSDPDSTTGPVEILVSF